MKTKWPHWKANLFCYIMNYKMTNIELPWHGLFNFTFMDYYCD